MVYKVLDVPAHRPPNHRTMAGIQEKIIEKCGQNLVSRLAHVKNDKQTITTWMFDLNRILHIFNICPVIAVCSLLTTHSQTELAINTNLIVSDVHHSVVNADTMVSDMHHNILKSQEKTDDQHRLVSDICSLFHH